MDIVMQRMTIANVEADMDRLIKVGMAVMCLLQVMMRNSGVPGVVTGISRLYFICFIFIFFTSFLV